MSIVHRVAFIIKTCSAYKDHFIDEIIQGIWIVQIIMSITNRLNKAFRTVQSITHKLFYSFMRLRISQTKQMDFFYAFGPLMKLDRHGHNKKKILYTFWFWMIIQNFDVWLFTRFTTKSDPHFSQLLYGFRNPFLLSFALLAKKRSFVCQTVRII